MTRPAFGAYVHIPFCAQRCDYCAFVTYTGVEDLERRYVDAVLSEMRRAESAGMPAATSAFFGGGTPSHLPVEMLVELVDALSDLLAAAVEGRAQLTTLLHFSEAEGVLRLARLARERLARLA